MKNKYILGLLLIYLNLWSCLAFADDNQFTFEEATIHSIQVAIKNHNMTCEQLINLYIDRVKKYNFSMKNDRPPINALTEINPYALDEARELDQNYMKTQQFEGSLQCIPVVVKDNINTQDMTTTAGSFSLLGNQPTHDAFLVAQLRKSGAIILGKGGMDEFASGMYGINSRNGRVGNAYDTTQNPGGSSSGPAAAVSANFSVIGIGTDNSGSIRIPAVFNGLIGLRPSFGLISQNGIFPAGYLDGVAGPIARTVTDLASILDIIAVPDTFDKKTLTTVRPQSYLSYLNKNGLHDKRIGIVHWVGDVDVYKNMSLPTSQIFQQAEKKLQQAGAIIVTNINLMEFNNDRSHNLAGSIEAVNQYLESYPAARSDMQEICESDRTHTFGDSKACLKFVNSIPKQFSQPYYQALKIFNQNKDYVEKIMLQYNLNALFIPIATSDGPTYDDQAVNTWRAPVSSNSGLPSIAFPIGYTKPQSMPVGVELVGKQFGEGELIEMAYAYEQVSSARKIPILLPANLSVEKFSIAQINNLINMIGQQTYDQILKQGQWRDVTAKKFIKIVNECINKLMSGN